MPLIPSISTTAISNMNVTVDVGNGDNNVPNIAANNNVINNK